MSLRKLGQGLVFLTGEPQPAGPFPDVEWLTETGNALDGAGWNDPQRRRLAMVLAAEDDARIAILVNG